MADVVGYVQGNPNIPANIARAWYDGGASVVPIQANGSKRPTRDWSTLQRERMLPEEVDWYWRPEQPVGVAVICGAVSGNLEMTELEVDASREIHLLRIGEECDLRGVKGIWDSLLLEGYSEVTPTGGIHLLYRISDHEIPGNTKLASTASGKTLAETRGEGGYVIVAPTTGACHPNGGSWETMAGKQGSVPTITWSQRMAIHAAITEVLDETPPPPPAAPRREVSVRTDGELRPGDDWEAKHDWDEPWFTDQGWQVSHRSHHETFWVRPGKDKRDGHSATTGYAGDKDRLYVWSTSAGLPTETPLNKFWVFAHYYHHGDLSLAAKALRQEGYGSPLSVAPQLQALEPWPLADDKSRVSSSIPPPPGGLDLTDTGSGRRMKELFGDQFRFNTRDGQWYEWTGTVWRKDERLAIHRAAVVCAERAIFMAQRALNEAEATGDEVEVKRLTKARDTAINGKNLPKLKAAMNCFASEPGISITSDEFNQDSNLLNLPNGTLDLESNELLPHDPTNLITMTMGAQLDKDAECPLFLDFMTDAFPDISVREYVQRCLGYTMLGQPQERAMFMLHGPSGTGKSVLTDVMTQVFGDYGTTAPASTFRMKKQSETIDLHKLRGARFVATSELPEGQLLDEDLVKRLTGGDRVTSRGHYELYSEWKPQCVIWIATNFLPKVTADDNAIWRRAKTIHMGTEFGSNGREEVLGYADVLAKERDGILNWLLQGLNAYRLRGLDEPDAVTKDIENYRLDVDSVACFIRDRVEEGVLIRAPEFEIRSATLRTMFDQYCTEQHQPVLGARRYQNRLKALGLEPVKIGGVAHWRGLRQDVQFGIMGTVRR